MTINKEKLTLLVVAIIFYFLALVGLASEYDALIWLVCTSVLVKRHLRPCFLILICGLQDAPGFSYYASYYGFAIIAWIIILDSVFLFKTSSQPKTVFSIQYKTLMQFALFVSLYSLILSFIQDQSGFNPQSQDRHYLLVFFLMLTMICSGYFSTLLIKQYPYLLELLAFIAIITLIHIVIIGILQILYGAEVYRSASMLPKILENKQLFKITGFNIPRVNGPFLSPNAMGMTMLLLSLLTYIGLSQRRLKAILLFSAFGLIGAILSLSKAVLGYYLLCFSVMIIYQFRNLLLRSLAFLSMILGLAFIVATVMLELEILQESFRIRTDTLGTREFAWQAVINGLTFPDWLFGIGLSAWPDFFSYNVGFTLSDPHSYILSVPGTFGITGVVFYLYLFKQLFTKTTSKRSSVFVKSIGLFLLLLFFGRDIASIPSILGNTQLNYIVWVLLGLFFYLSKFEAIKQRHFYSDTPAPLSTKKHSVLQQPGYS